MTLPELINILSEYQKEIQQSPHDGVGNVYFSISDPDIDLDLELESVELDLRIGCLCPQGVILKMKAEKQ
jgi:hypothetical protein